MMNVTDMNNDTSLEQLRDWGMSGRKWKKYKLGEIVDVKHGYAFKGEFFSTEPTGDVLLTPGNFKIGGGFKDDKFKYYKGVYPKEYILKEGDVIVSMTDLSKDADTIGYSAKVPASNGKRYLHNQRLGLLLFKSDAVDKDFIYWLLRTKDYQDFIANSATGTTVKHTSPARIKEYEFFAPEKSQQKQITSILSSLDDKIELNRQMNQTLEAMAQALFQEWFVDFRFPGATGELVESKLGMIPKGWRVGTLGDVVEVKGGTTPSTKVAAYWDGEFHWATPKDLSNLKSPILLHTERKITESGVKQISSGVLPEGTLLLSSRAPIGYLALAEMPVCINQGFIAITGVEVSNQFMLFWLKANMESVISRANGSTFLEISKTNFKSIPIIIPDKDIIAMFDHTVGSILEKIKTQEQQTTTLIEVRDGLLPRLMQGELII